MMVEIPVNCKFCGKPIVLKIYKPYYELRDPFGLIKLAACRRCAEMKVKQRRVVDELSRISGQMALLHEGPVKASLVESARKCLSSYVRLISEWMHLPGLEWDEAILDSFVASPREIGSVMNKLWAMAREMQFQPDLLQPGHGDDLKTDSERLPYKD